MKKGRTGKRREEGVKSGSFILPAGDFTGMHPGEKDTYMYGTIYEG